MGSIVIFILLIIFFGVMSRVMQRVQQQVQQAQQQRRPPQADEQGPAEEEEPAEQPHFVGRGDQSEAFEAAPEQVEQFLQQLGLRPRVRPAAPASPPPPEPEPEPEPAEPRRFVQQAVEQQAASAPAKAQPWREVKRRRRAGPVEKPMPVEQAPAEHEPTAPSQAVDLHALPGMKELSPTQKAIVLMEILCPSRALRPYEDVSRNW
jgi:hypothetical protein